MRCSGWVAVLVLAGGCNVKSSMMGGSTPPSSNTAQTSSSGTESAGEAGPAGEAAAPSGTERAPLPNLLGKTPDEATAALRAAGFTGDLEINRMALECLDTPKVQGRISCQNPDVGVLGYKRGPVNVSVYAEPTHTGRLTREQLAGAVGMTIDAAKAYLKSLGHDGEVIIFEQHTFDPNCGSKKVCSAGPGTGIHSRVQLTINPSSNVDITMPD